jgi:hypothetical protein
MLAVRAIVLATLLVSSAVGAGWKWEKLLPLS